MAQRLFNKSFYTKISFYRSSIIIFSMISLISMAPTFSSPTKDQDERSPLMSQQGSQPYSPSIEARTDRERNKGMRSVIPSSSRPSQGTEKGKGKEIANDPEDETDEIRPRRKPDEIEVGFRHGDPVLLSTSMTPMAGFYEVVGEDQPFDSRPNTSEAHSRGDAPDIEEERDDLYGAVEIKAPESSFKYTRGDATFIPSFAYARQKNAWMEEFDTALFLHKRSKKVIAAGMAGVIAGLIVPNGMAGFLLKYMGDLVHIPKEGALSILLDIFITSTAAPVFAKSLCERGMMFISGLTGTGKLSFAKNRGNPDMPNLYPHHRAHTGAKILVFFNSVLNAAIPSQLFLQAEQKYAWFKYSVGVCFIPWLWDSHYTPGARFIDRIIAKEYYSKPLVKRQKVQLKDKLDLFIEIIQNNPTFAREVYTKITERIEQLKNTNSDNDSDVEEPGLFFATSGLFVKDNMRLDKRTHNTERNIVIDEKRTPVDRWSKITDWFSNKGLTLSTIGRLGVYTFIGAGILENTFGFDLSSARITGVVLAAVPNLFRLILEPDMQTQYLKTLFSFRISNGYDIFQRVTSVGSFIGGGLLYASPNYATGKPILNHYTDENDIYGSIARYVGDAILGCMLMGDASFYAACFQKQYHELMFKILKFRLAYTDRIEESLRSVKMLRGFQFPDVDPRDIEIICYLTDVAQTLKDKIDELDNDTTHQLYLYTQEKRSNF